MENQLQVQVIQMNISIFTPGTKVAYRHYNKSSTSREHVGKVVLNLKRISSRMKRRKTSLSAIIKSAWIVNY